MEGFPKMPVKYWQGTLIGYPKINISRGHKRIVQDAKDKGLSRVLVAEDDIRFTSEGAYEYFISQIPDDYDMFLGSYYSGLQTGNEVKGFRGMSLYSVHERFYDTFLSVDETKNIDTVLSMTNGKILVVDRFCAIQEPGHSFQKGKYVDWSSKLKNKPIYNG